jgi:hypothetical protein
MCKRPDVTEYTLVFISTGCYGRLRRASGARTARALALRATFSAKFRRFSGHSSCPSEGLDPSPFDAPSRGLVGWYGHNARPAEARTNLLAAGLRLVPFGAAHTIGFPILPQDLLHVPATGPKWALSSSPAL